MDLTDLTGEADDRTSRLTDVIGHCQLSYRAGTRFNPEEVTFQGSEEAKKRRKKKKSTEAKPEPEVDPVITQQPTGRSGVNTEADFFQSYFYMTKQGVILDFFTLR